MPPPTSSQKLAVLFAFLVAALSLGAAAVGYLHRGEIRTTLLFGGLLMLALAASGVAKLRGRRSG